MNSLILQAEEKLDNADIIKIAREMKKTFGPDIFIDKQISVYTKEKGTFQTFHNYTFTPNMVFDESNIEKIVSILYNTLSVDFTVEFDYEESEDCEDCEDDTEVLTDAVKHELWVKERLQEGWRYGLEFSESDKTDPLLKPYYQLTDKQKGK